MSSLNGRVAIVTGSSRGIGRAIGERLAADGASVVINYNRSADEARHVVAGIEARAAERSLFRPTVAWSPTCDDCFVMRSQSSKGSTSS